MDAAPWQRRPAPDVRSAGTGITAAAAGGTVLRVTGQQCSCSAPDSDPDHATWTDQCKAVAHFRIGQAQGVHKPRPARSGGASARRETAKRVDCRLPHAVPHPA